MSADDRDLYQVLHANPKLVRFQAVSPEDNAGIGVIDVQAAPDQELGGLSVTAGETVKLTLTYMRPKSV